MPLYRAWGGGWTAAATPAFLPQRSDGPADGPMRFEGHRSAHERAEAMFLEFDLMWLQLLLHGFSTVVLWQPSEFARKWFGVGYCLLACG